MPSRPNGEAAGKYKIKNIVLVKVQRVVEISSPVYDTGVSEEEVKEKWVRYWAEVNKGK